MKYFIITILIAFLPLFLFSQNIKKDTACCGIEFAHYHFSNLPIDQQISLWRPQFICCPIVSKATYIQGVSLYQIKVKETKDSISRENYIDTIMFIYDTRIKQYGQEGYVLGMKGIDLLIYRRSLPNLAYQTLINSITLENEQSTPTVLVAFMTSSCDLYSKNKITENEFNNNYNKTIDIIEWNYKNNEVNQENYKKAHVAIKEIQEKCIKQ